MKDSYQILLDISQVSVVLPFLIGLFRHRHLVFWQKLLLLLLGAVIFTELCALWMITFITPDNNLIPYNINVVFMFAMMTLIFKQQVPQLKPIFKPLIVAFTVCSILNLIFFQPIDTYNTHLIVSSYLIYVCFAILFFINVLKSPTNHIWYKTPFFWFNTGVLLYYSTSLVLFFFVNDVIHSSLESIQLSWTLNASLYLTLNCFYFISLWKPHLK